jgi:hypothetical protein
MFKTLSAFAISALLVFSHSSASAQVMTTSLLTFNGTNQCLSLKTPNNDANGGGLALRDCELFPDFFVSYQGGSYMLETPILFRLTSERTMCVYAAETPVTDPTVPHSKVLTRNCASATPPGAATNSFWAIYPFNNNGFVLEKLRGSDRTGMCVAVNPQTQVFELDICTGAPEQTWKFKTISFP